MFVSWLHSCACSFGYAVIAFDAQYYRLIWKLARLQKNKNITISNIFLLFSGNFHFIATTFVTWVAVQIDILPFFILI
ncbi:hypothetical protein EDC94DRAFT_612061 [Helicostylum pulchrum]|nr:hypothetical protein EDC94DRAFT_612061 [Helicostylum pulchrum]